MMSVLTLVCLWYILVMQAVCKSQCSGYGYFQRLCLKSAWRKWAHLHVLGSY